MGVGGNGGGGDILTLLHRVIKEPPTKTEIINSKLGIKLNNRRKLLEEGSEEQRLITQVLSLFKNIEVRGESSLILTEPIALVCSFFACYFMYIISKMFDAMGGRFTIEWLMKKLLPSRRAMKKNKHELKKSAL